MSAAALALVVGGCGHHRSAPPVPPITRAEFVKEANAICARGNEAIAAAARAPSGAGDPGATTYARVFVPGVRDQIRQIRALGFPTGDGRTLDGIFDEAEGLLRRVEQDPAALDGHAFDDVNAKLTAYGLWVCGS